MSAPSVLSSPSTPRHRPTSSPAHTPIQLPASSSRTALSVQLFQERHTSQFAHLHDHEDEDTRRLRLAMEKGRLEEERRIGREKRQSLMSGHVKTQSDARSAWRPLSLLQRRQSDFGHRRAQSQTVRSASQPSTSRTTYLFSPPPPPPPPGLKYRSTSDQTPSRTLNVVIERESSPPPEETSSSKSTYSWATEFSGETTELRTAAHYVSSAGAEEEEVLDSPEKLNQRRKRIVAIAHTVRQLEGIGSREVEDPAFYDIIKKAWYNRPENTRESILGPSGLLPPHELLPTPVLLGEVAPFVPDFSNGSILSNRHTALRRYPPRLINDSSMPSPFDVEFRTPIMPDFPRESDASRRSRSMRYSYASTLHDLALEGGLEQGSKLMSEKAWLRASKNGTPCGGEFDTPPLRSSTPPLQPSSPPAPPKLESPISLNPEPPERTLRKYKTTISNSRPSNTPTANQAGPSRGWGLGFVSAFWENTPSATSQSDVEQGFQKGEDGIPRESRRSVDAHRERKVDHEIVIKSETESPSSSHCRRQSSTRSITSSSPSLAREVVDSGVTSETSSSHSTRLTVLPVSLKTPNPNLSSYQTPNLNLTPDLDTMMKMIMTPDNPTVPKNLHPDYDRSSSLVSLRDILMLDEHDATPDLTPFPILTLDVSHKPSASTLGFFVTEKTLPTRPPHRTNASITLFILGFFLPLLWIVGGWTSAKPSPPILDIETGEVVTESKWTVWAQHPDPWVSRCRWATVMGLPLLAIAGVTAIIVYLVLR